MKKGEIWLVEFPVSNGHEQAGSRPAIVIADTPANVAIIVPFTSNVQALRFPFTFEVKPTERNGLAALSIALIFQARAIDKRRFKKKVGDLDDLLRTQLDSILMNLLQL